MIGAYEKALCRKTASMFKLAGEQGYPVLLFTRTWFSSQAAAGLYGYDFIAIAQWALYQLNSLLLECPELKEYKGKEFGYSELMYWAGYILAYWLFADETSWKDISENYDYEMMLRNYDYLHTLDPNKAILLAKEEYKRKD